MTGYVFGNTCLYRSILPTYLLQKSVTQSTIERGLIISKLEQLKEELAMHKRTIDSILV